MSAPLDTVLSVTNLTSSRLLDAVETPSNAVAGQIGGEVTGPQQPFSQQTVNAAWRRLQEFLSSYTNADGKPVGYSPLINTVVLGPAPVAATSDPGINCFLGYDGYFDGVAFNPSVQLPSDLISPLRLKERITAVPANTFTEMAYIVDGLTGLAKRNRNYNWSWDNDALLMPGSTVQMDFELRYVKLFPDFIDNSPLLATPWYNQLVPLVRCSDAFAWYICAEYANARGDKDGAAFDAKAEAAATKMVVRESENDALRSSWVVPDIPAQTGGTFYDAATVSLNVARVRLNVVNKAASDVINVQSSWTQQYFNQAFRRLQEYLANKGTVRVTDEVIITGLQPGMNPDPAIQTWLDWTGYFNGSTLNTGITLPGNLILPFKLAERQTGQQAYFVDMGQILNGLPSICTPQPFNRFWEWRADKIYMPGATTETDLRIRYHKYLPDLIANVPLGATPWYLQQVPIPRCTDALSLFMCVEVATARPDLGLDASIFQLAANDAADLLYNRDVRRTQQTTITRRSLSGRLESGGGVSDGWGGYGY